MSTGNSDRYRIMIDDSWRFANDEVILKIAFRTPQGYRPVTLGFNVRDEITIEGPSAAEEWADEWSSALPRELAELLLTALGRYFLSVEGDLVITNQRLKRELARVTKQLEDLISGIGRLGGNAS